mgnify:FL=1
MNYGLYLSASGVLTNLYRQDVFANNLANVETVGFKPDVPSIRQRDPEAVEDLAPLDVSNDLLERLGGGVLAGEQRINFATARTERTSNPLDAALFRDGRFFAARARGQDGEQSVQLTRDGRFQVNARGQLALPSGHLALNPDDEPITVNPSAGPARIEADGSITQNGENVGRLQISRVEDLDALRKTRGGLYEMADGDVRLPEPTPELRPGYVEASGVDPFSAMMDVTAASKSAMGNADMIRYHGRVMDLAANTLGSVTG